LRIKVTGSSMSKPRWWHQIVSVDVYTWPETTTYLQCCLSYTRNFGLYTIILNRT